MPEPLEAEQQSQTAAQTESSPVLYVDEEGVAHDSPQQTIFLDQSGVGHDAPQSWEDQTTQDLMAKPRQYASPMEGATPIGPRTAEGMAAGAAANAQDAAAAEAAAASQAEKEKFGQLIDAPKKLIQGGNAATEKDNEANGRDKDEGTVSILPGWPNVSVSYSGGYYVAKIPTETFYGTKSAVQWPDKKAEILSVLDVTAQVPFAPPAPVGIHLRAALRPKLTAKIADEIELKKKENESEWSIKTGGAVGAEVEGIGDIGIFGGAPNVLSLSVAGRASLMGKLDLEASVTGTAKSGPKGTELDFAFSGLIGTISLIGELRVVVAYTVAAKSGDIYEWKIPNTKTTLAKATLAGGAYDKDGWHGSKGLEVEWLLKNQWEMRKLNDIEAKALMAAGDLETLTRLQEAKEKFDAGADAGAGSFESEMERIFENDDVARNLGGEAFVLGVRIRTLEESAVSEEIMKAIEELDTLKTAQMALQTNNAKAYQAQKSKLGRYARYKLRKAHAKAESNHAETVKAALAKVENLNGTAKKERALLEKLRTEQLAAGRSFQETLDLGALDQLHKEAHDASFALVEKEFATIMKRQEKLKKDNAARAAVLLKDMEDQRGKVEQLQTVHAMSQKERISKLLDINYKLRDLRLAAFMDEDNWDRAEAAEREATFDSLSELRSLILQPPSDEELRAEEEKLQLLEHKFQDNQDTLNLALWEVSEKLKAAVRPVFRG